MFIVWGKKRTEKRLGYVAEFCPICRTIQPFSFTRIGLVSHIYYVGIGKNRLVEHAGRCERCHTSRAVNAERYANKASSVRSVDILAEATFPNIRETYAERLKLEGQLASAPGSLRPEVRPALLLEPFRYLARNVEEICGGDTKFDRQSGFGCVGTIVAVAALFFLGQVIYEGKESPDWLLWGLLGLLGAGSVYTLVQLGLGPRRQLRRQVWPALARALKPLDPTEQELGNCLKQMTEMDLRIGKKITAAQLRAAIQQSKE